MATAGTAARHPEGAALLRAASSPGGGRGLLHRASALSGAAATGGADRVLPVPTPLATVLPGLRRGSTVAVRPGTSSLVLALLAGVSEGGGWSAVVGMPGLSGLAAAQAGVDLRRLALVPDPGPEWPVVVAALLDGVDLVVIAPPAPVGFRVASRLAARARLRGSVLMPYGQWEGADLTLRTGHEVWQGLEAGRGRLRCRELTVTVVGRGAAYQPRRVRVRLPGPAGRLAPVPDLAPGPGLVPPAPAPAPAPAGALIPAGAPASASPGWRRPSLALIEGGRWREEAA